MSLKEEIQQCKKCPLFENMVLAPVSPEWRLHPDLMIIVNGRLNNENDLLQENISGINRVRLIELLEANEFKNWYITSLLKCRFYGYKNPTKKYLNTCSDWIVDEQSRLKPKATLFMGPLPVYIKKKIKIDYTSIGVGKVVESAKNEEDFIELLGQIRGNIRGSKL